MIKKRVLINASNIHGGGALQVAISFLTEMIESEECFENVTFLISSKIASEITTDVARNSIFEIVIWDGNGFNSYFSKLNIIQSNFDVVFTLFGPKYTIFKAKLDIVGFAQPWIINSDNAISRSLGFLELVKSRLKFKIQEYFFLRSDHLIVELEHVKKSLVDKFGVREQSISVVYNTISSLYYNKDRWAPVEIELKPNCFSIGLVSRGYPHKNIGILSSVAKILKDKYKLSVMFYFTLTDSEWAMYQSDFDGTGCTVGPLTVYQCPSFYQKMDAVIFPSLLECFSATPLEALFMEKPLFASDRGFVKDVCKDYAIYFDPEDSSSIASSIANFLGCGNPEINRTAAKDYIMNFSNSKARCNSYIDIIKNLSE